VAESKAVLWHLGGTEDNHRKSQSVSRCPVRDGNQCPLDASDDSAPVPTEQEKLSRRLRSLWEVLFVLLLQDEPEGMAVVQKESGIY
jgi:hypothetical protein